MHPAQWVRIVITQQETLISCVNVSHLRLNDRNTIHPLICFHFSTFKISRASAVVLQRDFNAWTKHEYSEVATSKYRAWMQTGYWLHKRWCNQALPNKQCTQLFTLRRQPNSLANIGVQTFHKQNVLCTTNAKVCQTWNGRCKAGAWAWRSTGCTGSLSLCTMWCPSHRTTAG